MGIGNVFKKVLFFQAVNSISKFSSVRFFTGLGKNRTSRDKVNILNIICTRKSKVESRKSFNKHERFIKNNFSDDDKAACNVIESSNECKL